MLVNGSSDVNHVLTIGYIIINEPVGYFRVPALYTVQPDCHIQYWQVNLTITFHYMKYVNIIILIDRHFICIESINTDPYTIYHGQIMCIINVAWQMNLSNQFSFWLILHAICSVIYFEKACNMVLLHVYIYDKIDWSTPNIIYSAVSL